MINKTENLKKFNKHAHEGLSYVDQSLGGVPVASATNSKGKGGSTAVCRRCGIVLRPAQRRQRGASCLLSLLSAECIMNQTNTEAMERKPIKAKAGVPLSEQFEAVIPNCGSVRSMSLVRMDGKWSSLEDETGLTSSLWVDYHSPFEAGWGYFGRARGKTRAIVMDEGMCALVDEDDNVMGSWRRGTMRRVPIRVNGKIVANAAKVITPDGSYYLDAWGDIWQIREDF